MPAISVFLDGQQLARVNTDGFDVVSVHVHGVRTESEFAALDMTGGVYPEGAESTYLSWINCLSLTPGQEVEVRLDEAGETSHEGRTIEEMFPEEEEAEQPADFTPNAEMFAELRSKTAVREGYAFRLWAKSGPTFVGRTAAGDHGFGFNVVWNCHRPKRASVSLHAYTLDSLEQRSPMNDFAREYIEPPCTVRLRIDA